MLYIISATNKQDIDIKWSAGGMDAYIVVAAKNKRGARQIFWNIFDKKKAVIRSVNKYKHKYVSIYGEGHAHHLK